MKTFFLTFLFICFFNTVNATAYDFNNLNKNSVNIINGEQYQPGDTLRIKTGLIAGLRFINLHGADGAPIVITNKDGQVQITELQYDGIKLVNCSHVHLTGTGQETVEYGFFVLAAGQQTYANGVYITDLSTYIEVDHIEVRNTGFAGIVAKTDPKNDNPGAWRRNGYVFDHLHIHHNYVHDTHGEGMYIGHTGGYLVETQWIHPEDSSYLFGHWLDNLHIHDNFVFRTGLDGIQVNLARENCHIHHNIVHEYGTRKENFHAFGFSIGSGVYSIYNNKVIQSSGNLATHSSGMQLISADSETKVINNVINNTGGHAFLIHMRHKFKNEQGITVAHNTIVNTNLVAIKYMTRITIDYEDGSLYSDQLFPPFICKNNLICGSNLTAWNDSPYAELVINKNYIEFQTVEMRDTMVHTVQGNLMGRNVFEYGLIDPNARDFAPADTSSLVYNKGVGLNLCSFDFDGHVRIADSIPDVGAFEYISPDKKCVQGQIAGTDGTLIPNIQVSGLPVGVETDLYGRFSVLVDTSFSNTIIPQSSLFNFIPSQVVVDATSEIPPYDFIATEVP